MRKMLILLIVAVCLSASIPAGGESPYIYGLHFWREGANLDCFNGKIGWITELKISPDYASIDQTEWRRITDEGHTIILRVNFDGSNTFPQNPADYEVYASRYAHWAERVKDYCHIYIIGNEEPMNYECFRAVRNAIHAVQPEAIVCPGCPQYVERMTADLKDYVDGYVVHGVSTDWIPRSDANWPSAKTKPIYVTETAGDPPNLYNMIRMQMAQVNAWNTTHDHKVEAVCKFVYYEYGAEYSSLQMEPMQDDDFRQATAATGYWNSYANPYLAITNAAVTCPSETVADLTWATDVPSTGQVEYWREGERTQSWSTFQSAYSSSHSISLTDLVPGATYHYQMKSWAPNRPLTISEVGSFQQIGPGTGTISGYIRTRSGRAIEGAAIVRNPGGYSYSTEPDGSYVIRGVPAGVYSLAVSASEAADKTITGVSVQQGQVTSLDVNLFRKTNYLTNTSFESGTTGWTAYSGGIDPQSGSWFGGITSHGGGAFIGGATNNNMRSGGVYQRVAVPSGPGYSARVFSRIYRGDCPYIDVKSRIGIDPTGGTSPSAGSVVWSAYDYGYTAWDSLWNELVTPSVTVTGGYATVFLDYRQTASAGWHINCFDDAGLFGQALETQTAATAAELKTMEDGVPVSVSGRVVTTNTSDFGDRIYIEDPDRTSGIAVYPTGTAPSLSEGDVVNVTGTMGTVNGERAVTLAEVTKV